MRVHLVTDDQRVELRRFADHAFVCKAPCGVEVPVQRGEQFRLEGQGLNPSDPVEFAPTSADVRLKVRPGSKAAVNGGIALIVVGGLTGVGSLAASVAIAAQQDQQRSYALPLALSLLSTAAIGGGIALVATSHSTHYSTEP